MQVQRLRSKAAVNTSIILRLLQEQFRHLHGMPVQHAKSSAIQPMRAQVLSSALQNQALRYLLLMLMWYQEKLISPLTAVLLFQWDRALCSEEALPYLPVEDLKSDIQQVLLQTDRMVISKI